MHVITKGTLRAFWEQHADAKDALQAWFAEASRAEWRSPTEVKQRYRDADPIAGNRVVFNIKGNKYRVIAKMNYSAQRMYICFVGTHAEYDRVDAATVRIK